MEELLDESLTIGGKRSLLGFVEDGGLEGIVDGMRAYPDDEGIQSLGCVIIANFFNQAVGDEEAAVKVSLEHIRQVEERLIAAGFSEVLACATKTFPGNEHLLANTTTLLLRFAQNLRTMASIELPVLVLSSTLRHLESESFVSSVLEALFSRVQDDLIFQIALIERDVFPVLLLVMAAHRAHAVIQCRICQLLFFFADKLPSSRFDMMHRGLAAGITAAMKEHINYQPLLIAACGTLWHLANENDQAKMLLVTEARAIRYLVRTLFFHADQYKLQVMACGALCSLALADDPNVVMELFRWRVTDALGATFYLHDQHELITGPALVVMHRMEDFLHVMFAGLERESASEETLP